MELLEALKFAANLQGDIFQRHKILMTLQLEPQGIMIRSSSRLGVNMIEMSRKISWVELEQLKYPGVCLNDAIDREVQLVLKAQEECDRASTDAVAGNGCDGSVPIWQRNECCSGAGDN